MYKKPSDSPLSVNQSTAILQIDRLTALWALSEAALGGVLHAFHVPFTGLFINSAAVLFMVLIASASDRKGIILRATIIVLIVKGMVSPHTPFNAYIAVAFQGILGEYLLRYRKYLAVSAVLLGILTLLQSATQKIIVLTIVYGRTLWESIDIFGNFVIGQLPFISSGEVNLNISIWLISIYIGIHLFAGAGIGLFSVKIPAWIKSELQNNPERYRLRDGEEKFQIKVKRKKKNWLQKPSNLVILILALAIVGSSYIFSEISETQGFHALVMIVRSVCIMSIWYVIIGPQLLKLYKKFIKSKRDTYAAEVENTIHRLTPLRFIIYESWGESAKQRGLTRIKSFVTLALVNTLTAEFYHDKNNFRTNTER